MALVGAALPSTACGGGGVTQLAPGIFNSGKPSQVALNDVLEQRAPDVAYDICRDAKGLYALAAYCTHAHCVLQFETPAQGAANLGFICNCHNSEFDYNGAVLSPPAPTALAHYKLTLDAAGDMIVDTNTVVDPATRTAG
jgi:Rieske Fe-S protein